MYSWDRPEDRISILQINSELRHAQLELISAHCATHQLRLRFNAEDIARFGQRDVLLKSVQAASALNEYYSSLEKKISGQEGIPEPAGLSQEQVREAIDSVSSYLREQRERYLPTAAPLSPNQKATMWPYFSPDLLDQVKIVQLENGARVPPPPFYQKARALGFENLPEIAHMNSLTFLEVVVFNERVTDRSLFHALVHAVQFDVLGLGRYSELFVNSFIRTRFHFSVPLEAHAFSLESKFAGSVSERFSVEDQVRLWVRHGRYDSAFDRPQPGGPPYMDARPRRWWRVARRFHP